MNVTVRGYISQFRVRELQAVLEQLGLSRTGRKADLVARIFAFFGEEPPTNPRHVPALLLLPPPCHTHLGAACLPLLYFRTHSRQGLPHVANLQDVHTSWECCAGMRAGPGSSGAWKQQSAQLQTHTTR